MRLRTGKLDDNVLSRSVEKRILGAVRGADEGEIRVETDPITLPVSCCGELAVHEAANDLCAAGAIPQKFQSVVLLPVGSEESLLRSLMDQMAETCITRGMTITGGHAEVTSAVSRPVVIGAAAGRLRGPSRIPKRDELIGQSIVMSKWIGIEGTYLLATEREEELCRRFPVRMVEQTRALRELLSIEAESAAATKSGAVLQEDCSEGGIFSALYRLAQRTGTGLDVDLRGIPVLQQTIEYASLYDINPYQMESAGALLMVSADPAPICEELAAQDIPARVIGTLTAGRDRILRNVDEVRYLDRPAPEALLSVLDAGERG